MLAFCVVLVFRLLILLFHHQNVSTLPSSLPTVSDCNCIRAKDCVPYTSTRFLHTDMDDEFSDASEQVPKANCGFTAFSEPMVCCPRISNDPFTKLKTHHSKLERDRVIWDRKPLIDDYINRKTHRNCPPILFTKKRNHFDVDGNDHKHFQQHHQHYPHAQDKSHIEHYRPHDRGHGGFHKRSQHHGHGEHHHDDDKHNFENQANLTSAIDHIFLTPNQNASNTSSSPSPVPSPTIINSPDCGVTFNNRIIGGIEAAPGEFSWVARIAYLNSTDNSIAYRCSGSFVSQVHILTAAHCVVNLDETLSLAHVSLANDDCGSLNQTCQGLSTQFEIAETIVHPSYENLMRANDIAIIRINKPEQVNYGTICLPLKNISNNNQTGGGTGIVAGWSNDEGSEMNNFRVRYSRLNIIDNAVCAEQYTELREGFSEKISILPSMMCTEGQSNVDICRGDSGGPLIDDTQINSDRRYTLLGIVAFGPKCGFTNLIPSVYMRISAFLDWIISNIR